MRVQGGSSEFGKRRAGVRGDSFFRLESPEKAVARHTVPVTMVHGIHFNELVIEGKNRSLITETGSNISILKPSNSRSDIRDTAMKLFGVTGRISM